MAATTRHVTVRMAHEHVDLLDAWTRYFNHRDGVPTTRVNVMSRLLLRAAPPQDADQFAADVRRARSACSTE